MLDTAVQWALARIAPPPVVAGRAAAALAHCLAILEASAWPDAIACFSGLNADGCPIELAFSSRDHAVRFTAEAAAPEVPATERFARAERLLQALSGGRLPGSVRAQIAELHRQGALTWGAAVAGRHTSAGDRFKLYAEVPASPLAVGDLDLRRARLQRLPRLVMLGWESGSDYLERYYRSEQLAPGELGRILDVCGLGDRARELEHAVSIAWQGTADRALSATWGLSLAGPRGGRCAAVSLFKEANRVLGGDARAREGMLRLVAELDAGELDAYARVAAPLAEHPGSGAHGMLAISVARDRPLELRIGLSPTAVFSRRSAPTVCGRT